jgi:hypothetical protein
MLADLLGLQSLKAVAAATAMSPAPRVFSAVGGFETFSNQFVLRWQEKDDIQREATLSRQHYLGLRGPYNRRNVYGAALSYGPALRRTAPGAALFASVVHYAFCREGGVLRELGLQPSGTPESASLEFRSLNPTLSVRPVVEVQCH